jgi:hypothetical protein
VPAEWKHADMYVSIAWLLSQKFEVDDENEEECKHDDGRPRFQTGLDETMRKYKIWLT